MLSKATCQRPRIKGVLETIVKGISMNESEKLMYDTLSCISASVHANRVADLGEVWRTYTSTIQTHDLHVLCLTLWPKPGLPSMPGCAPASM